MGWVVADIKAFHAQNAAGLRPVERSDYPLPLLLPRSPVPCKACSPSGVTQAFRRIQLTEQRFDFCTWPVGKRGDGKECIGRGAAVLLHFPEDWVLQGRVAVNFMNRSPVTPTKVTAEFLNYSKSRGNDLMTPAPMFSFPGLKPGDRWCLWYGMSLMYFCLTTASNSASRWKEAYDAGCAPPVFLEATHENVLRYGITLEDLKKHAIPYAGC
eukprot:768633-Hanusia_phi.AAC.5